MSGIVENGLTIATAGTAAYLAFSWMQESAVVMYAKLALMLPSF